MVKMPSHDCIQPSAFGQAMRNQHFTFDPAYTPLNHGSYGAFPVAIRDYQRALQDRVEARSDPHIRFTIPKVLNDSRAAAASFLGAPMDDVVFVPNATTAVNTVLRNLEFVEGDTIIYFSSIYPGCEKTVHYICESTPAVCRCIDVTFPMDDADLIALFIHAIRHIQTKGGKAKLAICDTIITFPGLRLPWEKFVKVCQEFDVLSLIDGAHGIGHIDLTHLASIGPDFFTSDCYKWLYTPRGCAIFYVPFRNQYLIRSTIPTSKGFHTSPEDGVDGISTVAQEPGRFGDLFKWAATVDQTPYLTVPEAIKFRNDICGGETVIREYCFNLARDGGQLIANLLGTETMPTSREGSNQCCLTNVRLPLRFSGQESLAVNGNDTLDASNGEKVVTWLQERTMCEYDTWIPAKFYGGAVWVRLSAQIYLELKDFEWAGSVLKDLCVRAQRGEWRGHATRVQVK